MVILQATGTPPAFYVCAYFIPLSIPLQLIDKTGIEDSPNARLVYFSA
jgi:hypothetical protein